MQSLTCEISTLYYCEYNVSIVSCVEMAFASKIQSKALSNEIYIHQFSPIESLTTWYGSSSSITTIVDSRTSWINQDKFLPKLLESLIKSGWVPGVHFAPSINNQSSRFDESHKSGKNERRVVALNFFYAFVKSHTKKSWFTASYFSARPSCVHWLPSLCFVSSWKYLCYTLRSCGFCNAIDIEGFVT